MQEMSPDTSLRHGIVRWMVRNAIIKRSGRKQ